MTVRYTKATLKEIVVDAKRLEDSLKERIRAIESRVTSSNDDQDKRKLKATLKALNSLAGAL